MQPLLQQFKAYLQNLHLRGKGLSLKQGPTLTGMPGCQPSRASDRIGQGRTLLGISPSSIKNYVSDINHFLNFIAASIQETEVKSGHITPAAIKAYSTAAVAQLSPSSLNRHLSSLRYFGRFLLNQGLCETDPAQNLTNPAFDPTLAQVITRYQKFLTTEALSKSTIKNYVSDLKKYLLWARKNIKTTDEVLNVHPLI